MSKEYIQGKIEEAKEKKLDGIFFEGTEENILFLEENGFVQWGKESNGTILAIDAEDEKDEYVWLYEDNREEYLEVEIIKD